MVRRLGGLHPVSAMPASWNPSEPWFPYTTEWGEHLQTGVPGLGGLKLVKGLCKWPWPLRFKFPFSSAAAAPRGPGAFSALHTLSVASLIAFPFPPILEGDAHSLVEHSPGRMPQ